MLAKIIRSLLLASWDRAHFPIRRIIVPFDGAGFHVDFEIKQAVLEVWITAADLVVYFINADPPDALIAVIAQH